MEEALLSLVAYALGIASTFGWLRRPRKPRQEDRDAGLRRYMEWKANRNG